MRRLLFFISFLFFIFSWGQEAVISGKVVASLGQEPLEYATVSLEETTTGEILFGGITDSQGNFKLPAKKGNYLLKVQFFSMKPYIKRNFYLNGNLNLGVISLEDEVAQLEGIELTGQRTTVEMHLDKKIYNVGQDMTAQGGSVTDVLGNVPSVSVDSEGGISLRGSENVQILINGKPSSVSGITSETLQQLPADMIEKVEVVTNPSARYEAQGSAGIINIVLKKGKGIGLTGSVSATVPVYDTQVYSSALNLNYRTKNWSFFNTTTYQYNKNNTQNKNNSTYFKENTDTITNYQREAEKSYRKGNGFNTMLGAEYRPKENISITNSVRYNNFLRGSGSQMHITNLDAQQVEIGSRIRQSREENKDQRFQYSLNYDQKLNEKGQRLTFDYQLAIDKEKGDGAVTDRFQNENTHKASDELTHLLKADYTLPFSQNTQLEAGYQSSFKQLDNLYQVFDNNAGVLTLNTNYTNHLLYKENIHALYTQWGTRWGKFNAMAGLRMEHTDISIGLKNTPENKKKYTSFFPSLFTGYQVSEQTQYSLSYTRRLQRPHSRFINPFVSRTSSTNLFTGNPDLNPAYTHAFDLGLLRNWDTKLSLNASAYYQYTTDVFSFINMETGGFATVNNLQVPIMITRSVNLAEQQRYGAEFTFTYTPALRWRFSWNINFFNEQTQGNYTYLNHLGKNTRLELDAHNTSWSSRFSVKGKLPLGIDFQTNAFYMGPRTTAQAEIQGEFSLDGALSKEVWGKKGSLVLNVRDLLNSRRMRSHIATPSVQAYKERQLRPREITLSFTYRFGGMDKNERKGQRRGEPSNDGGDGGEFMY